MGLPEVNIVFRSLAISAIERSERGIVALVVNDDTATKTSYAFKKFAEVMPEDFKEDVYDYIRLAFLGNPNKVIVEVVNETRTINETLKDLQFKKFNYLAVPGISSEETELVSSWIIDCREEGKMYKAVLPNTEADNEGVINFATTGIKVGEKTYTTEVYCARIAGILAGLPLTRSATYFVLNEVDEITDQNFQKIEENGVMKVGIVASKEPPMAFVDEDYNIVGFDMDLAKKIGEYINENQADGKEIKIQFEAIKRKWLSSYRRRLFLLPTCENPLVCAIF